MRDEEEPKSLVVIYDWCIPLKQFQKIVPPRAEFAEHIFACLAIKQDMLRENDYAFFAHVADVYCIKYPNCRIMIITQDQTFSDEVERHRAYQDGSVEVVTIIPCNSENMNNKRAEEVAGMLIEKYGKKYD